MVLSSSCTAGVRGVGGFWRSGVGKAYGALGLSFRFVYVVGRYPISRVRLSTTPELRKSHHDDAHASLIIIRMDIHMFGGYACAKPLTFSRKTLELCSLSAPVAAWSSAPRSTPFFLAWAPWRSAHIFRSCQRCTSFPLLSCKKHFQFITQRLARWRTGKQITSLSGSIRRRRRARSRWILIAALRRLRYVTEIGELRIGGH